MYKNLIIIILLWVYSLMDRISGFGPEDLGSIPSRPVNQKIPKF